MKFEVAVSTIYNCSLERAFKTPFLCDISKVHTGFGQIPRVTHTTGDENWGQIGSSKKVYVAKSIFQKAGFAMMDKLLDRVENKYWKFQINEFQSKMMRFDKFVGEWKTTEIKTNKILIEYNYSLYSNSIILFPFNWIFAKIYWKRYMYRVLENVRKMIMDNEPYQYK